MDDEHSVRDMVYINRKAAKKKHSLDDILFLLVGDATAGNILTMVFAVCFFAATPIAMLLFFGAYSGGMRWLIVLALVTAMASVAIYLMRRGVVKHAEAEAIAKTVTSYPGELTKLTDAFGRAAEGYVYSQQVIRERVCEIAIDRIALARGLDREQVIGMLEDGDVTCVGDQFLAQFLLTRRKGAQKSEESQAQTKGKSRERGERFMLEIDEILNHMEATT
ncbi:MAG: hypothetical protein PHU53_04795 [Thermoplasmata archaeon]|nr:hypothetical protein [Thermoplasmata archaeon]